MLFFAVDAAFLTAFGWLQAVPLHVGWRYGLAGLVATGVQIMWFRRGVSNERRLGTQAAVMSLSACLFMLGTSWSVPEVGGLMLMSLMTVLAAASLQLRRNGLLAVYLVCAVGAAGVILSVDRPLQWPMNAPAQRALTSLWFAWLLAKCAAINVAGTHLRRLAREANLRLATALVDLDRAASTDDLTVLPNRRSIIANLDSAVEATERHHGNVGVALFDIDNFKSINDRFGHGTGDDVLRAFGSLVTRSLRPTDVVGRYGGEEFLLVLHDVRDVDAARETADRMRREIERHDWLTVADGLAVTASAGVTLIGPDEDGSAAIQRADAALYIAKAAGRNKVIVA